MTNHMNAPTDRPFQAAVIVVWLALLGVVFLAPSLTALDDPGDFLIRNTVRVALVYWAAAVTLWLENGRPSRCRLLWTLAAGAYFVHVATAFEEYHHWSHAAAVRHVEQTSGFGAGIFVSYGFTLLWAADVAWWWLAPQSFEARPRWLGYAWHGFLVFVIFNGTVVYETGMIRWAGGAVLLALLGLWLWRVRAPSSAASNSA
jgi:hypothetical protein